MSLAFSADVNLSVDFLSSSSSYSAVSSSGACASSPL